MHFFHLCVPQFIYIGNLYNNIFREPCLLYLSKTILLSSIEKMSCGCMVYHATRHCCGIHENDACNSISSVWSAFKCFCSCNLQVECGNRRCVENSRKAESNVC
jgi:hypothetical protein